MFKVRKPTKCFFFKAHEKADEMFGKSLEKTVTPFFQCIGWDIFSTKFTVYSLFFCAVIFDMITYLIISIYNIYLFREDFIRSTFCVVTLGMGFQGSIKLYTFVFRRPDMLQLYDLIVLFQQSVHSCKIHNALENSVINSCTAALILIPTYMVCAFMVFIYPLVYYIIYDEKILHFGFILPFIDEHSQFGYALNFFHHSLQIFLVVNVLVASNILFILFINGAFGQYDALTILLQELDTIASQNDNGCNDQLIKQYIKEIARIHVDLMR